MASGTQAAKDTRETVGNVAEQARETASQMADQARQGASYLADQARQAGSTVANQADNLAGRVGSGMETAADSLRHNAPNSGMLGSAASRVADTLESGGRYLEEEGLTGLAGDVTNLIKRNPIPALLIAVAIGVLIARATRS